MSLYKYRNYFLLGAGVGAFLCYKFNPFLSKNPDSFQNNKLERVLYNNLSKFNFNNKRPKLLLINSDLPISQIMNSHMLPKDLDVYKINLTANNKSEIYYLNNILGFYGNSLCNLSFQKKTFDIKERNQNIAINSYGDIQKISNEKINNLEFGKNKEVLLNNCKIFHKKNKGLNIFKRLNILTKKEKFLKMLTHDFMLLYCTKNNQENISYSLNEFVIYRYIFRKMLKGFNINFYAKVGNYPIKEIDQNQLIDTDNRIYIVQRKNILNTELFKNTEIIDTSQPIKNKNVTDELNTFLTKKNLLIRIDNNDFIFTDITKDLDSNDFKNNYMQKLIIKGNLFYYINNSKFKFNKNNIKYYFQYLNQCFQHKGYFHIICNLFFSGHQKQVINFINEYKNNIDKFDNNTPLLINDCSTLVKPYINIMQFFKEKYYKMEKYPGMRDKNEFCRNGGCDEKLIFKKRIVNINGSGEYIWMRDKEVRPENIHFFHQIKYLF